MTVPTRYESEAACEAAAPAAVFAHSNFDFPSLLAECRPATSRTAADRQQQPERSSETRRG
jgi:hypothetical protein